MSSRNKRQSFSLNGFLIGRTEIDYSLEMIERARKRLNYQRVVVERLGGGAEPRYAALAMDMLAVMEIKLSRLIERHDNLLMASAVTGLAKTSAI